MWDQKDWILAAVVSIVTLVITKGWPIAQWVIEFLRKSKIEDGDEAEQREDRLVRLRSEGYEQVIARLDKTVGEQATQIARLQSEHTDCIKQNAAMTQEIIGLKIQVDTLLAWKRSRGGSDTIVQQPKKSDSDTGGMM